MRERQLAAFCRQHREAHPSRDDEIDLAAGVAARAKAPGSEEGRITIELPISQSELALLIGASRPKVNTALSMLESSGALERNGSKIVCDIEELQAIAGAE